MVSAIGDEGSAEAPVARVTAGVFFGSPVALPRGPHALPPADVVAEQRERLMAAITELIAAGGYPRVTIGALAGRAKISRTAFYRCFPSKEACAFAAYDRFIEVLLGALARRAGEVVDDLAQLLSAVADAYFSMLEQDLVVARAFLVEFDALGPKARERRRVALRSIASYLRHQHEEFSASDATLAPLFADEMYLGIVYIARQLACDALDERPRPNLRAIGEILAAWLLPLYRPGEAALSARGVRASGQRSVQ
jgi:AcrR family transcriptional regulator